MVIVTVAVIWSFKRRKQEATDLIGQSYAEESDYIMSSLIKIDIIGMLLKNHVFFLMS